MDALGLMRKLAMKFRMIYLITIGTVLALICMANEAQASSYGYSVQQTNGYSVSGASLGSATLFSSSGASLGGSPGESFNGSADTLQSYVGNPAGRPAENTFPAKGMTTPDYGRGDALLTAPTLSTASVAEALLAGSGSTSGTGAWSISAPLTLSIAGSVTLSFNYTNQLSLVNDTTPSGAVATDFTYDFNIQNSSGITVFSSSPTAVNRTLSLTSQGNLSFPSSGSISITSGTLSAGTYTMTLSGASHVFINSAVPEPSTYMLLLSGSALVAVCARARRRLGLR
jgi:hypothetical protein